MRCSGHGTRRPDQRAVGQAGPLLPKGKKSGRPPTWSKRQLIDGIRWRTRTGAPWRDVPARYGPWQTVYGLFRRWQRDGTWQQILTQLQAQADAKGLITWEVSVDSTVAGPISTPPGPAKGGPPTRRTGRGRQRAGRPRPRALPGRADQPSCTWRSRVASGRCRSWSPPASAATARSSGRCWAASGCRGWARGGPAPGPTGCWPTRPTAPGPTAPCCAAAASAPPSREGRPGRPPAGQGPPGRPAAGLRRGGLQAAARGGVRGQPAQAAPGGGHPVRQARRPLPGHRAHRRDQRVAMTSETRPSARQS